MKITFPAQAVSIQRPTGEIDPTWYGKLKQVEGAFTNGLLGDGQLATTATTGFAWLPKMAGAPTGLPQRPTPPPAGTTLGTWLAQYSWVPCVYDTTNHKLWIYDGAWKGVVLS